MMSDAVDTKPSKRRETAFVGQSLKKTYITGETQVHALRGVDLEIEAGEILVLLGPSGSGKSTLLNIIGGLDRPTSGQLWYRDTELTALSEAELTRFRRASIGFIFQFYNLIPSLTAEENVRLVIDIADDPMPAKDALELVGLADRRHHFPAQLSGGEQQRVAVARALINEPAIVFADEPSGNLDSSNSQELHELLFQLRDDFAQSFIIVTHNEQLAAMSDRRLEMVDGILA